MRYRIVSYWVVLAFTLWGQARADWLRPVVSARAHVDSLNRFLVLQDPDQHKVFGGQILSLGDVTGDGATDILICRDEGSYLDTNWAFLYYGGPTASGTPAKTFAGFTTDMGIIGDVNNDGYVDLGRTHGPAIGTFNYEVYFGGPAFDDNADFLIPQHWSLTVRAVRLDGTRDLLLPLSRNRNRGFVDIFRIDNGRDTTPRYTLADTSENFGNQLAVGDFNGDGYPDLAVGASLFLDSGWVKFYWGGSTFDTIPDFQIHSRIAQFGTILLPIGDFNADGYEDILICGGDDSACGIYYGGPHLHDKPDVIVNKMRDGSGYFPPTSAAAIGDFNHDGYPDFVLSYDNELIGQFSISIFLGGPRTDTSIIGDIFLESSMLPGLGSTVWRFGELVAGIGDFNGDGIDDIAASSHSYGDPPWWGHVHVICGYDNHADDVPSERDSIEPNWFKLNPSYPNPLNSSTTIRFDVIRKSSLTLTVYNSLGQVVRQLMNKMLNPGSYQEVWNGCDEGGHPVASGVYLCRLTNSVQSQTIKMQCLK